jgi:CRISPR/Cas system CSM-associated protein Csm3 (group 7 of RAMP superfamily)
MTLPYPFPVQQGIQSALHCRWTLTLKTPLVIRHGSSASYKNNIKEYKKGRGQEKEFSWRIKNDKRTWTGVADFNYHFFIDPDGNFRVAYSIPASSIRGALRQWAIKQMLKRDERSYFQSPKLEGFSEEENASFQKQVGKARECVEDTGHNWHHILSLFGNALDFSTEEFEKLDELKEKDPMTWASRLKVTTTIKSDIKEENSEEASKEEYGSIDGIKIKDMPPNAPDNIQRHINVRNPLDRMTMAAKNQGLHHALEMSPGQVFEVELLVLNPKPKDIVMLTLWEEDINEGFLRFGGLTSQGRGRCMLNRAEYNLYASATTEFAVPIASAVKQNVIEEKVFDGFWTGASFTIGELKDVFENIGKSSKADESQT